MDSFDKSIKPNFFIDYPALFAARLRELGNKPAEFGQQAYQAYKGVGQEAIRPALAMQVLSPDLRPGVTQDALAADQDINSAEFKRRQALQRGLLGNGL